MGSAVQNQTSCLIQWLLQVPLPVPPLLVLQLLVPPLLVLPLRVPLPLRPPPRGPARRLGLVRPLHLHRGTRSPTSWQTFLSVLQFRFPSLSILSASGELRKGGKLR